MDVVDIKAFPQSSSVHFQVYRELEHEIVLKMGVLSSSKAMLMSERKESWEINYILLSTQIQTLCPTILLLTTSYLLALKITSMAPSHSFTWCVSKSFINGDLPLLRLWWYCHTHLFAFFLVCVMILPCCSTSREPSLVHGSFSDYVQYGM